MNNFDVEDYDRLYNCRLDTKVVLSFNHDDKNITLSSDANFPVFLLDKASNKFILVLHFKPVEEPVIREGRTIERSTSRLAKVFNKNLLSFVEEILTYDLPIKVHPELYSDDVEAGVFKDLIVTSIEYDLNSIEICGEMLSTCYKYIYQLSEEKHSPRIRKLHNLKYGFIKDHKNKAWIHLIRHNTKATIRKFKC